MIPTAIGNYPKVAEATYGTKLIGTLTRWQRKELSDADLEATCRTITRAVIKEQEAAGLQVLTDGQIRWEDLVTPVARRLDGFEINGLSRYFDNNVYYRRPILHKTPRRRGPILVDEYRFAASCTKKPVKAVLPAPYSFARLCEDRHFKRERPFALRMAELLNEEAKALARAGAPIIQFDEPALGFGKPDVKLALEALSVATRGVKAQTAVVSYFGSLDGALTPLLRAKVDIVGVDVVSDPGALARLGRERITSALSLGCLDARNTKLEPVSALHAVFRRILKQVPADRLYVSPNCGLEFLPHPQARAKLRRLGEAVRSFSAKRRA